MIRELVLKVNVSSSGKKSCLDRIQCNVILGMLVFVEDILECICSGRRLTILLPVLAESGVECDCWQ